MGLQNRLGAYRRWDKKRSKEIKEAIKNNEIMQFRANSKFRQLDVIAEAKDNFMQIKEKFVQATPERQNKLMNNYLFYGTVSLNRIVHKKETVKTHAKNKLFLYGDIEMVVFYFFSIKKLYPYLTTPHELDYLEFEELLMFFLTILTELSLTDYSRALRFPVPDAPYPPTS